MAPRRPTTLPKRTPASLSTTPTSKPTHKSSSAPTKRLKRESKHATLLSRISKTAPGSKVLKRRRPSKKLVTTLDSLADALPTASASLCHSKENDASKYDGDAGVKIKHKSLKSRPGAGRKKERLVAMERERFGRNMALMAAGGTVASADAGSGMGKIEEDWGVGKGGSKERWAAIRGFISQTMERRADEGAGG